MAQFSVSEKPLRNFAVEGLEFDERKLTARQTEISFVLENLISEGGNDFYNYLCWLGLSGQPNIMVLSSLKRYYYDNNDLKNIGVLVSLKKLNQVTHLESFIHTLFRLLPFRSSFVGCFYNADDNTDGSVRKLPGKVFKRLFCEEGTRTGRSITRRHAVNIMENNGFTMKDMTEINGVTYFWAQNNRRLGN